MAAPIRILLQTTIPPIADDWHIGRFSMLRDYLTGLADDDGSPLCDVTARDRAAPGSPQHGAANPRVEPCQSDATGMMNAGVFPISSCGQRNGSRAFYLSGSASLLRKRKDA